uniref:ATP-binding protein n=1 Tax=Candidatus Roseilinea sp. TaxID=2838777 RepID=UPI004049417E
MLATRHSMAAPAQFPPVNKVFHETFALAGLQTRPLEGERRIATVLLADVCDSTRLLEQLGSEAWVEVMNQVFQILETQIYRFGGEVNQFRGDGLVAFFGASVAHEDDPERAVLAALGIQNAIKTFASKMAERDSIDLKLRIGVNTGDIIVTTVGDSRQHREDTAMGQAVAVAARMESAAEAGTVLVSDSTYQLIAPRFSWKFMGEITVKGVSEPIAVYRPLEHQPDTAGRPLPVPEPPAAVISRAAQLEALERCIADVLKGRGGICFVSGEKGAGKSFIVSHVSQRLFDQGLLTLACLADDPAGDAGEIAPAQRGCHDQALWLHGLCRSYDQDWPFSMWRDLLRRWLGAQNGAASSAGNHNGGTLAADAMPALLRQQVAHIWGEQAGDHYPYLASLLSLPLEEPYATQAQRMDAEMWQRQLFQTIRSWLAALAERQPIVVVFSDLHWADPSSIELLRFCLPLCDNAPILWLMVFRPDRTSPVWSFRHHVETEYPHRLTRIELPPLTDEESGQLIDELIGPGALSPATRELVIQRAEGNPYFIRELIHSLTASGALAPDETGRLRETRKVSSLDLPDSLQSLLMARMDRLTPEQRRVLQIASVIGPTFWRNMLAALVGDRMTLGLQAILTVLQRAQFIQERGAAPVLGMEYAFTSTLVRDVAYDSLLATQRAAHHLQAAEYLEEASFWGTDLERSASLIAWHYRMANRPNKELFYSLQAAEQSRKVYANAEAIQHYTRALEILDKMADGLSDHRLRAIRAERFEVLSGRRDVLYLVGDIEAARSDSRELLQLARELSDEPAWLVDALLRQPEVADFTTHAEAQDGVAMAQEALRLSRQIGDRRREVNSLMRLGTLYYELRDPRWRETSEQAWSLLCELGDLRNQAHLLLGLAFACGVDDLEHGER